VDDVFRIGSFLTVSFSDLYMELIEKMGNNFTLKDIFGDGGGTQWNTDMGPCFVKSSDGLRAEAGEPVIVYPITQQSVASGLYSAFLVRFSVTHRDA